MSDIVYIIPELTIIAVIFGMWKIAYEIQQKVNRKEAHSTDGAMPILLAVCVSGLGVLTMIWIANLANQ